MKVRRILVLIAAAALAQLGYAKPGPEHEVRPRTLPPVRAKAPNYAQLGAEQAVLDFCSSIDSGDAKEYGAQGKTLFAGIREDGLEKARGSSQYKNAYTTFESAVSKIPPAEAVQGCKALIATTAPVKASGKTPPSDATGKTPGHPTTPGHTTSPGGTKDVGKRAKGSVRE